MCLGITTVRSAIIFIYNAIYFLMAEAQVFSEFSDTNLQIQPQTEPLGKLPKIDAPRSRQAVRSKNEKRKTPPLLPFIKPSAALPPSAAESQPERAYEPDSFASEIEERLKMVLENVNHGQEIVEDDAEDEDVDFEELIQQNREKLKQNKLAKNQAEGRQPKSKSKTLKNKNQNSIYQKRIKEYRDASTQNKFIQKRKEVLALRQEAIERANQKAKTIKMKEENNQNYSSSITKLNIPKSNTRPKYSAKDRNSQEPTATSEVTHGVKIAQLFDNIHNFLQNPFKARAASESRKPNTDTIKELQEKIKQINDKLGVKQEQRGSLLQAIEQKTVLDWKRLEYNRGSNFRCHYDSNFEKQVEKISNLQQKNSHSLTNFLNHQKALAELTLLRKVTKKPQGKTS